MNKQTVSAFLVGLIFGVGLLLSGMANPEKVLGFLDLAGAWDPSLALVMGGAILVGAVGFQIAQRRELSFFKVPIKLPGNTRLDRRLILGSLGFGVGWGLAGFCPGPALVALGAAETKALVFTLAMLVGMVLFEVLERARSPRQALK